MGMRIRDWALYPVSLSAQHHAVLGTRTQSKIAPLPNE